MEFLYKYLKKNKISLSGKTALDLGCGTGRNSISLAKNGAAKVYALDFVPKLVEKIKNPKIVAQTHDLTKPWPIPTSSVDIAIDIFCFKHQTSLKDHDFYKEELARILKPGALLLITLAGIDDGFYGIQTKTKFSKDIYKIVDPVTGVGSLLFTKESLEDDLKKDFSLLSYKKENKLGMMHGGQYKRSTLKFIFKRK